MNGINEISDDEIVFLCIRNGIKAVDVARYLGVNRATISKIQSRKIKKLNPRLHCQLYQLYQLLQATT